MKNKKYEILLSIRLMTYMHEAFIARAMDGIMMQKTNFKVEIVIGDDFSTDDTLTIIRTYNDIDNIKISILNRAEKGDYYKKRKDNGRVFNFINIVQHCKGKYIALLDGDDFWTDPYKLQKQVDFLEANPEYVGCFHKAEMLYEYYPEKKAKHYFFEGKKEDYTILDTFGHPFIATASLVIRRIEDFEFPDWFTRVPSADMALVSLLAQYGMYRYFDEVMSVYRIHEGGVAKSHYQIHNMIRGRLYLFEHLNEYYNYRYSEAIDATIKELIDIAYHQISDEPWISPKQLLQLNWRLLQRFVLKKIGSSNNNNS